MKDIMKKLAELEATAPKVSNKKMLKEDSTTPPINAETKPTRLKDIFETMATTQPVPVVGKQGDTHQTGAGFINVTDNSPAAQALSKAVGDLAGQKKLQIVVPTQPGQTQQSGTTPAPAGATGQPQAGQQPMREKWGTDTKVAPSEKGKYAGKDKAELTKAYNKLKASGPHKKGSPEFGKMRELAFAIRAKSDWGKVQQEGAGAKDWHDDMEQWALNKGRKNTGGKSSLERAADRDKDWALSHRKSDTVKEESMEESGLQAYLGNKKYGKEGMNALRKAGREGASKEKMAQIRAKYDKIDEEDMEEGAVGSAIGSIVGSVVPGGSIAGAALGSKIGDAISGSSSSSSSTPAPSSPSSSKPVAPLPTTPSGSIGLLPNTSSSKPGMYEKDDMDEGLLGKAALGLAGAAALAGGAQAASPGKTRIDPVNPHSSITRVDPSNPKSAVTRVDPSNPKSAVTRIDPSNPKSAVTRIDPSNPRSVPTRLDNLSNPRSKVTRIDNLDNPRSRPVRVDLEEEQLDEKFASQQQAKLMYATAGGADTGVSKKVAKEFIKKSHGQKVGKLPKKKTNEVEQPTIDNMTAMGAGLGAGRSQTTLEAKEPQVEVIDNAFNRENYKDLIGKKYPKSKAPAYARVKEISEGAKPDFLDLDKDGNKKESMKKAAADKKKQKVKESMNHRISAARLEGKSHGLRGHAHSGKRYEDLEELKAYHEGYKEGLDECYGQGVYENAPAMPAATVPGMASAAMPTMEDEMEEGKLGKAALALGGAAALATGAGVGKNIYDYHKKDASGYSQSDVDKIMGTDSRRSAYDREQERRGNYRFEEDEMEEGNAFTGALAKTPKGGKFTVGGKTFTDNSNLEEYAFEAWDRELSNLLNEGSEVNEGLSVSVSKGQQNSPDSVTITAQDNEADELLKLVKSAGLGLFADEEPAQSMSVQPDHGEPHEIGTGGAAIDVVDGDDMLSLMKKIGGVEAAGAADYADEEGHKDCGCEGDCDCDEETNEATCNECGGMMEAGHSCGSKEMVDEVESEDQMEFEVAEDSAGADEVAMTTADEDAEAEEDSALAKAAQQNKTTTVNEGGDGGEASEEDTESKEGETDEEGETVSESFASLFKKLDSIAEGSGDKPKHPEHDKKDDKDYDDAEEELDESEQLDELSPELLDRAEKKAYDQYWNLANKAHTRGQSVKKDLGYGYYTKDVDPSTPLGKAAIAKHQQYKKFGDAGLKAVKRDQARADLDDVEANTSPAMRRKLGLDESELNEWANQVGKGPGKGTDASFEQDIEFMTKVIAGGLNKPKSTGQTTIPVIAGQEDRMHDNPQDWATLAGIKK